MTDEAIIEHDSNIIRLLNSLKTPDIIKEWLPFSGDTRTLHQFIENVEDIIVLCKQKLPDGDPIPASFIKAIKNKIRGEANLVLINAGTQNDWNSIKNTLIDHYADKRTVVALIRDLHRTRQGFLTTKQFYSKILEIQTALTTRTRLHDDNSEIKEELYKDMCLAQFIANLREPLGSNIRAREPETLADALEMSMTEENMYYLKYKPPIKQFEQYKQNTPRIRFNEIPKQEFKNLKIDQPGSSGYQQKRNSDVKVYQKPTTKYSAIKQEKQINNTETDTPASDEEFETDDNEDETVNDEFFTEEASDSD